MVTEVAVTGEEATTAVDREADTIKITTWVAAASSIKTTEIITTQGIEIKGRVASTTNNNSNSSTAVVVVATMATEVDSGVTVEVTGLEKTEAEVCDFLYTHLLSIYYCAVHSIPRRRPLQPEYEYHSSVPYQFDHFFHLLSIQVYANDCLLAIRPASATSDVDD